MFPIATLFPVLQSALAVFGAFEGTAAQAKATAAVQDAIGVIGAIVPLVQSFGSGQEVTEDQVRAALAGKDAALAALDAEIARRGG